MLVVHTNLSAFCNASVHEKGLLILCILCNFDCFCFLSSEAFFKIDFFFSKTFSRKTIRLSNSLDMFLVKSVCKGFQQVTNLHFVATM